MGSQGATFAEAVRMVFKSGGNWKRPVNRMYTYNFQIGENYYLPMTSYLEGKNSPAVSADLPGPSASPRGSPSTRSVARAWRRMLTSPWRRSRRPGKSFPACNPATTHTLALVHTDGQQQAGRGQELDSATRAWPEAWLHAGILQLDSSTASAVSAVSRLLPACCCSSENDSSSCLL